MICYTGAWTTHPLLHIIAGLLVKCMFLSSSLKSTVNIYM